MTPVTLEKGRLFLKGLPISVALLATLAGCNVTFPQVDALRSQFSASSADSLTVPEDAIWMASFQGEGRLLAAYQREGYVLFANADNDAEIEFDGWIIRSLSGFGMNSGTTLSISDEAGTRAFLTNGAESASVNCDEWKWTPRGHHLAGAWVQSCEGIASGTITLNEAGEIIAIDQALDRSGRRLILQRYKRS